MIDHDGWQLECSNSTSMGVEWRSFDWALAIMALVFMLSAVAALGLLIICGGR